MSELNSKVEGISNVVILTFRSGNFFFCLAQIEKLTNVNQTMTGTAQQIRSLYSEVPVP